MFMSYEILLYIIEALIVMFIGIPTIYALFFGSPFVPTTMYAVREIIKNIEIKKGMKIYELGCGDARFLTTISKEADISAVGFEYSPMVYMLAKARNFFKRGKNVKILYKSYINYSLADADIVFCFLLPQRMEKLQEKLKKECKKGTLIIAHGFPFSEMKQTLHIQKDKKNAFPTYFYKI